MPLTRVLVLVAVAACGREARVEGRSAAPGEASVPAVIATVGADAGGARDAEPPAAIATPDPLVATARAECTPSGWCRFAELVPGDELVAMYSDADDRLWAVGAGGLVLRWDGVALTYERAGTQRLVDVWSDGVETYAMTKEAVLHRRGGTWTSIAAAPATALEDLDGAAGHAWVIGPTSEPETSALIHVAPDGATDSQTIPIRAEAVWVAAADDIWVLGEAGVRRWHGATWTDMKLPAPAKSGSTAWSIDGTDPKNVWVRARSLVLRWDGRKWRDQTPSYSPPEGAIRVTSSGATLADRWRFARFAKGAWAATIDTHGVAVSLGGTKLAVAFHGLEIRDGQSATFLPIGSGIVAWALWSAGESLWLAGSAPGGRAAGVAWWDGHTWQRETLAGETIHDIDGVDSPWLLGGDGQVWRRSNGAWRSEDCGVANAFDLAVIGEDEAWVAGVGEGALAHQVDGVWYPVPIDGFQFIESLAAGPDGSLFLVGRTSDWKFALLRWDGTKIVHLAGLSERAELVVHSSSKVDVVYRSNGGVMRWTGAEPLTSITSADVLDAARVGDDVYFTAQRAAPAGDPSWKLIDVPAADVDQLVARNGVVWAMQRPAGDLWVKQIPGAPRDAPRAPVVVQPPTPEPGVIDVPIVGRRIARVELTLPAGWTQIPGDEIVFQHTSTASLAIGLGFEIPASSSLDAALSAALDRDTQTAPGDVTQLQSNRTASEGYVTVRTYQRAGSIERDVTCYVTGTRYAVRLYASGLLDDATADALAEACKRATLR